MFLLIKLGSFVEVAECMWNPGTDPHSSNVALHGAAPDPSGTNPHGAPVLEGIPVPKEQEWEAVSSPFYCSSVVHIPGEIQDPLTLSKLGKWNGLLMFLHENLFSHVIEAGYTKAIQLELDQTAPDELHAKLDSIIRREHARFQIPKFGWVFVSWRWDCTRFKKE